MQSCVFKVNMNCETCKRKVLDVLQNLHGVYSIVIDAEKGTVKVSGKVNPYIILKLFEKYGKHGEVSCIKFEGEVKEPIYFRPNYFGGNGYMPYGPTPQYPLMGGPNYCYPCYDRRRYGPTPPFPPPMAPPPPPPPLPAPLPLPLARPPAPLPPPISQKPPAPPPSSQKPPQPPPPKPKPVISYFPPVVAPPNEMNPESCKIM
ncbi:hypothetical protein PTKIN_Ptkin14bG0012400 [Pterospermum kingtungense]